MSSIAVLREQPESDKRDRRGLDLNTFGEDNTVCAQAYSKVAILETGIAHNKGVARAMNNLYTFTYSYSQYTNNGPEVFEALIMRLLETIIYTDRLSEVRIAFEREGKFGDPRQSP